MERDPSGFEDKYQKIDRLYNEIAFHNERIHDYFAQMNEARKAKNDYAFISAGDQYEMHKMDRNQALDDLQTLQDDELE